MNAVAEIREEYKSAVRQYIRQLHSPDAVYKRVEFYEGRVSGLEVALSCLGVNNDEIRELYQACEEEMLDVLAQEVEG